MFLDWELPFKQTSHQANCPAASGCWVSVTTPLVSLIFSSLHFSYFNCSQAYVSFSINDQNLRWLRNHKLYIKFHQLIRPSLLLQRTAHLHHPSPRFPDRPQHQEELGACEQAGRHSLLLLRCHKEQLSDHQCGWSQGTISPAHLKSLIFIKSNRIHLKSGGKRVHPKTRHLNRDVIVIMSL